MGKKKVNIYEPFWRSILNDILECIEDGGDDLEIKRKTFESYGGERTSSGYDFSINYENGDLTLYGNSSLHSSAVARDLNNVLSSSLIFKKLATGKRIHFRCKQDRMDKSQYLLCIEVNTIDYGV
ncbi:MAG: hypothetical protein IKO85_03015 [Bacteroidaceae bacterium]|nr:hypothetical protein [Bacteroidaceae bacterium]